MFTGIVEAVGKIAEVREGEAARTLLVEAPFAGDMVAGQSVALDGACLTVRSCGESAFAVEAGAATLARTIAGGYQVGTRVNLERGLRAGDRLDGHWVQGHVDGVGAYLGRRRKGATRLLDFRLPEDVHAGSVLYGSVALNGVSMTVNDLRDDGDGGVCQVAVVPHTWEHTNFAALEPGTPVNVEADLVGKYVRRFLESRPLPPALRQPASDAGHAP